MDTQGECQSLISVITICRNAERWIADTMRSVLQQDHAELEYIVMDGLSTDRTIEIAKRVVNEFPWRDVKIYSEADRGISDAMNKGVRCAIGVVVAHLHAGDTYVDSKCLGRVMESFRKEKWRWAVAESLVVDGNGVVQHTYRASEDYRTLIHKNCIPHQSTFLVRDVFAAHGLFRPELRQAMDYEFWLRIAFKGGERYRVLPFATTFFRAGGASANVWELVRFLGRVRAEFKSYGPGTSWVKEQIFLIRVILFAGVSRVRLLVKGVRHRLGN